MKKSKDNIEYRSGWKRVIREGLDANIPNTNKTQSNTQSVSTACNNVNLPKNNVTNVKINDTEKILYKLEDYKEEIDKKLDNLSDELDTLISIILEASTQESAKESTGIKRLLRNLGIK